MKIEARDFHISLGRSCILRLDNVKGDYGIMARTPRWSDAEESGLVLFEEQGWYHLLMADAKWVWIEYQEEHPGVTVLYERWTETAETKQREWEETQARWENAE